jgi:zinc protease
MSKNKSILIDRNSPPPVKPLKNISLSKPNAYTLGNGIPCYSYVADMNDVSRIELVFPAGSLFQNAPLIANATSVLLREGTSEMTGPHIAELIDYYGAMLGVEVDRDFVYVSLVSLNKHLDETLAIAAAIVRDPIFPEQELDTFVSNGKQQWMINMRKVGYVARQKLPELLYGKNHPYGSNPSVEDFENLTRAQLIEHFQRNYSSLSCSIYLAGNPNKQLPSLLEKHFGAKSWGASQTSSSSIPEFKAIPEKFRNPWEQAQQAAIRLGKRIISPDHKDFHGLKVLNTIFGGYFGSRLMVNIREDKGYTYGIGSALATMRYGTYFFITSEVGKDVVEPALQEIYKEMERMQTELVPDDEMETVKSYLSGQMLRSIDGPFSAADRFKALNLLGLDTANYAESFRVVNSITATEIRDLAIQYFNKDTFTEIVVG